jgi:hypothetical protein
LDHGIGLFLCGLSPAASLLRVYSTGLGSSRSTDSAVRDWQLCRLCSACLLEVRTIIHLMAVAGPALV